MRPARFLSLSLFSLLVACGGATPKTTGPTVDPLDPSRLYPLEEGNVWSYNVDTGDALKTLAISKVVRVVGARVEVSVGTDPKVYELRADGIYRPAEGVWLLPRPLALGTEWPSTKGMTARVASVTESVSTNGGDFTGCVLIQERGGEQGLAVDTTYCPDVGPVRVESQMALQTTAEPARVSAVLLGFARPEDGLSATE